jgi:hypothetical protein
MDAFSSAKRAIQFVLVLQLSWWAWTASAAAPVVRQIQPRGLQIGATTTLVIEGSNLAPEPRLLLSGVPIANQTVKAGATADRLELEVTLDAAATTGIYLARLSTSGGVSGGEALAVSPLHELPIAPQVESLPVALSGVLTGSNVLSTKFNGRAGQRIVADLMARRLGASIDPVVHIYNARGDQLAWSPALRAIDGDARAQCILPADGEYRVDVHDALYRAGSPGQTRLCLGELAFADFVFPLGLERGKRADFQLIGAMPAGQDHASLGDFARAGLAPAALPLDLKSISGGRPPLVISEFAELTETPETSMTELTAPPVAVSGRLLKPGAEGIFRVPVKAGKPLRIEVQADRLGLPVDALLSVHTEQGAQLATNDDRPGTKDPGLDVTPPADAEWLVIKVRDLYGSGGADHLYRLVVLPAGQPDINVTLADDRLQAAPGAASVLRVKLERTRYPGPVRLTADGLPPGVKWDIPEIPAGVNQALVSLSVSGESAPAPATTIFSLRAETVGNNPIVRLAASETKPANRYQPWLRTELAAASAPAGPLGIVWAPWSADAALVPGKLPFDVQLQRAEGVNGAVRVSLLTNQVVPTKKEKVNNQEKTVDAIERTLRLAGELMVAADQAATHGEIVVPGDLSPAPYDLALHAELLGADNKTVVATAFTPVRRLPAPAPLKLELFGAGEAAGVAGIGSPGKFSGKLSRAAGFSPPVKIQLTGLPKDVPSPLVTIAGSAAGGSSDFELVAAFPFGVKPGPLADLKLVAIAIVDPQNPTVESRSNEIPVKINLVAGEKPPVGKPQMIFEDQPEFVAALVSGQGQVSLITEEKFSGSASCKVTPDQRFNSGIPGIGVRIREKPGEGEYRYLQFAWKKRGGMAICMQLNHDGAWGPTPEAKGKFRYHAGTGPECYGASLVVDNKLPDEFVLVTRDLFADFGEFNLTGLALSPIDGEFALFDHIYLAKAPADFEAVKP